MRRRDLQAKQIRADRNQDFRRGCGQTRRDEVEVAGALRIDPGAGFNQLYGGAAGLRRKRGANFGAGGLSSAWLVSGLNRRSILGIITYI